MKKLLLFIFSSGFFIPIAFSQKALEWMPLWERSVLDSVMNLYYTPQENFVTDTMPISIERGDKEYHLASKDGNFIVLFKISQPFTREDSIRYSNLTDNTKYEGKISWDRINKDQILIAKDIISDNYGKENTEKWKNYVQYLSDTDAKTKFNADTAFYISLPEKRYTSKYNHCKVLIIHKKDRGCLPMFFYYNDDAKEKLTGYISAMESSFRYGDEPPAKNKLENQDVVEMIALPMQEKSPIIE